MNYNLKEEKNEIKKGGINMKLLVGERRSGKTTELVKKSHKDWTYIVCLNRQRVEVIEEVARKLKLDIPYPITVHELPTQQHCHWIKKVLVDDMDEILESLISKPIDLATTSCEIIKKANTLQEYLNYHKAIKNIFLRSHFKLTINPILFNCDLELFPELKRYEPPYEFGKELLSILKDIHIYFKEKVLPEDFPHAFNSATDVTLAIINYEKWNKVKLGDVWLAAFGVSENKKAISIWNKYKGINQEKFNITDDYIDTNFK